MTLKKLILILILILALAATFTACNTDSEYVKVSFYVDGVAYQSYWVVIGGSLNADVEVPDKEGMTGVWSVTNFDELTENVRVDAIYSSANCTITFKVDTTTIATLVVKKNSSPANIPTVPTLEGYDGTWNYSDFNNISQDITVTALYTPIICSVSFMNGDDLYATRTTEYGGTITNIPTVPSTVLSYTSEWVTADKQTPVYSKIKANLIVYAYNYLTIALENSYLTDDAVTFDLEQDVTSIQTGERSGYDFYGWYYDTQLTQQVVFPLAFDQNKTLYARWLKTSDAADFTFTGSTVTGYSGDDTQVVIPYKYSDGDNTVYVTTIGANAFASSTITSISIPGTVTEFKESAFKDCTALTTLVYPDQNNVILIGQNAFENCINLTNFSAGVYLNAISAYTFVNCNSLNSVSLGSVTSIGDYAFSGITTITALTIPSTVTVIGEGAFRNMTNAVFTFTGNNIATLGDRAFENCIRLTGFTSTKLQSVGDSVFAGCYGLTAVSMLSNSHFYQLFGNDNFADSYTITSNAVNYYIPKTTVNLTVVANAGGESQVNGVMIENALLDAYYVKNVTLSGSFTTIEQNAFKLTDSNSVTSPVFTVIMPNNIVKISSYAFASRTDMESIALPASLYEIGEYAFYYLDNLATVTIPVNNGLTKVGKNAFSGTAWLYNYNGVASLGKIAVGFGTLYITSGSRTTLLPSDLTGLTQIAPNAFSGLSSLLEIQIPSTIVAIGESAFSNCVGLKKIEIPVECITIGNNALSGCYCLQEIKIGLKADLHKVFGSTSYSGSYTVTRTEIVEQVPVATVYYIPVTLVKLTLSADIIVNITADRYSNYTGLTTIILNSGIIKIYDKAFEGNINLTAFTISSTVTEIGTPAVEGESCTGAFNGCTKLATLTIPVVSALNTIYEYAFYGTAIKNLQIPSAVTAIGEYAFANTKLESLVFVGGTNPLTIEAYAFSGITTFVTNYLITFPSNLISVGDYAFYGDTTLNYVTLNSTVTSLGEYAFALCNLRSFSIPSAVELFDEENNCLVTGIIQGNANLTSLTLTNGITMQDLFISNYPVNLATVTINGGEILDNQFLNLTSLQLVTLSNVTQIGNYAFSGCSNTNLLSITIPASVTSIGDYAFSDCTGLNNFLIFSGSVLETVGERVFENDTALKQVLFPSTVTNTSWVGIFNGCVSLTATNIPVSVAEIGANTFYNCNKLTEIEIPDIVTAIGDNAFYNCVSTSFVNTNFEKLITLGDNAFYNCIKMQSFKAEYIADIGDNAFSGCTDMTEITVINSAPNAYVVNIDKLTIVNVSNLATSINSGAFATCTNLAMIFFAVTDSAALDGMLNTLNADSANDLLLDNVGIFIQSAMYTELSGSISNYTALHIYSYPTIFASTDYVIDEENLTAKIISCVGAAGVLYIPQKVTVGNVDYAVTSIGNGAFKNYTAITNIIIPSSVVTIESEAFSGCVNLTNITFESGSNLISIASFAFENCSALTVINLPDNLVEIGLGAFSGCSNLESVYTTRNSKLSTIGEYAFALCEELTYFCVPQAPDYFDNSFPEWPFEDFTIIGD